MKLLLPAIVLLIALGTACSSGEEQTADDQIEKDIEQITEPVEDSQPDENIALLMNSIPSPLEMTEMLRSSGADYSERMLNNTDNQSKYINNFQKALNLGVYGADLGYMNIYGKSVSSIGYITAVKSLADDLNVGQFFDFNMLKRLAQSSDNIDSLLYITTTGFNRMDDFLRENKRGNISALILTGTWLEGLYLAAQVNERSSNQDITDRIAEQKETLANLILILEAYKDDKATANLIEQLNGLQTAYDQVEIVFEEGEMAEPVEINGVLVVEDNSTTTINMSDEALKNITDRVNEIRLQII